MKLRIIALLIIPLLLSACGQDENSIQSEQSDNRYVQVKNSNPNNLPERSNTDIADHLATVASNQPEVNDAAAVVAGPYAVVGIDVDKDLDRSRVGTIKYTVLEALYHDPYGKTAVVVADADVMERLQGLAGKIRQGQPVQGIVDELSTIVGRYMPDFPINNHQPVDPDQNKETIPEEDKEQLENIQEEQSNHRVDE